MSGRPIEVLFVLVLVGVWCRGDGMVGGGRCGTGEWGCFGLEGGLKCLPHNKYCDGIKNCPDGSDEPPDCTNCNQTFSGVSGVKYPLRVTGPFQRFLPFVCTVNFVAMGGDFGDAVELSFLSFQIGRYSKDPGSACKNGYMRIFEPVPKSPEDPAGDPPHFGSFCGRLSERSATFYSKSSNVTLLVVVPGRASVPSTTFSLFLTYRFLSRSPHKQQSRSASSRFQYGNAVPGTFCDRVFLNCHLRPCRIRSPNFPGFYPRNITCNYHLRQMQVPHASLASIVLNQTNDYKIFVPRGGESSPTSTPRSNLRGSSSLSTDCADVVSDSVRIYDGSTTDMPLLAKFCGDGPMPSVISSGPEILVQLYSAPYSVLCSSRLEIEVNVNFEPETASFMQKERSRCSYIVDANRHRRTGVIVSPKYTMPDNSSCTYKFIGASSYDRIWVYFVSYLSRTMPRTPNTPEEENTCVFSKLEMFNSHDRWPMVDLIDGFDTLPMEFCGESRIPRMCLHAADYPPHFSPGRPCKFPEESYLSSGPTFALKHTFLSTLDAVDVFSFSNFAARYEFVDTRQDGIAIGRTECDRRFDSRTAKGGFISNPKNIFLYGRGGRENISCAFHFVGLPSERVRITIFNMKLSLQPSTTNCQSQFDNYTQKHICATSTNQSGRSAYIRGIEYWDSHSSNIGCVCNITSLDKSKKFVFDSLVNNVKLLFSVNYMTAFEDFTNFNFDAKFEFFNSTFCDTHIFDGRDGLNPEGTIEFHVPQGRTNFTSGKDMLQPLRCRWQIRALTVKYLYLQFKGRDVSPGNCRDGMLVMVYLENHFIKPSAKACVSSETRRSTPSRDYHVFSQSWYNDTYSITDDDRRDFMFIEIVASSNWKGIKLNFHWMEVTKPFFRSLSGRPLRNVDCVFECPEIGACIDPHLWCDGIRHCPSGFDESPANCHPLAKGMEYLSVIVTTAAIALFIFGIVIAWAIVRHRHKHETCSHTHEEADDRTKDFNHRLTPTEDYPMENHSS